MTELVETQNIQTAFSLAAEGMGATVCPELYLNSRYMISGAADSYARQQVEVFPFLPDGEVDTIAIGYNRERYLSQMGKDFIQMSIQRLQSEPPFETSLSTH